MVDIWTHFGGQSVMNIIVSLLYLTIFVTLNYCEIVMLCRCCMFVTFEYCFFTTGFDLHIWHSLPLVQGIRRSVCLNAMIVNARSEYERNGRVISMKRTSSSPEQLLPQLLGTCTTLEKYKNIFENLGNWHIHCAHVRSSWMLNVLSICLNVWSACGASRTPNEHMAWYPHHLPLMPNTRSLCKQNWKICVCSKSYVSS